MRSRRNSLPDVFPEDMRHRASTRKEIDQMRKPKTSPDRERLARTASIRLQGTPEAHHRNVSGEASTSSPRKKPRPPPIIRRKTAIHSDMPAEAIGMPHRPSLRELKRSNSIPSTLHVLVVEDNLVNQKVLAKQLRTLGCIVSVANHGVEAIDFLKETKHWNNAHSDATKPSVQHAHGTDGPKSPEPPFDLSVILMDWEMPIMNGLEATAEIRKLEKSGVLVRRIPVIGVTANVRQQQIQMAMDAGMDDVVSKPFRVAELMGRMKGIVQGVWGKSASSSGETPEEEKEG